MGPAAGGDSEPQEQIEGVRVPCWDCWDAKRRVWQAIELLERERGTEFGFDPLSRFFRESDELSSGYRQVAGVRFQAAEAYSTRCLNRSNFPRPYIERLMSLSLFTLPSVCPWL